MYAGKRQPAIPQEKIMSEVRPRYAADWSLGRRATDRLWAKRVLPGRHLDWAAWEAMTEANR